MHLSCFSIFLKIWKKCVLHYLTKNAVIFNLCIFFIFFSIFQKKFHKSKNGHVQKDKTEIFFEKIKG